MAVLFALTARRNIAKNAKDSQGGNILSLLKQVVNFAQLRCARVYRA